MSSDYSLEQSERFFIDQIIETGRFSRNALSQVLFEVSPGDYVHVAGPGALHSILRALPDWQFDEEPADDERMMWGFLTDNKWKLPRTGGQPSQAVRS